MCVCVRACVHDPGCDKKTRSKEIRTEILGKIKKKISAIVMVLAGKENTHFNLPKLPL